MKHTTYYQQVINKNAQLKRDLQDKEECRFNPIGLLVPAIGIIIGLIIQFL